ncbi:FliC/FljB family flagellin [Escherichia coli]|uniref:FliC/FljB family flagellin n=1 Tax=Escherichia TaxID=561 RepID=UPI0003912108|nr:FliC/FljB family flagellin [Escherichia coli]EQZ02414.1 flagellin [Escherichia coli UMEA 3318-1]EEW2158065.1 flagellin FliC [Escherichia coli]EFB6590244.1 flagellin FliC [Escherichia coli]EFC4850399.1 flagellin FliC [Escherichia coli]EFE4928937.1 flagellin FliC [Escherichia coli]
MAQVINTNSLSLITQNNINKNQSALSSSIERLSSGLRINSAKDDAAGQAIANRFTSNIKGLTQAARNANDGISVAQTTEGALSEINNNLQRIRELTVQASTGTNSDSDLDSIQDEIKSRLDEIDRVSGQTQFNGVNVLAKDGSMKIQVGANDGQTITIDLKKIDSDTLGLSGFNVNGGGAVANTAATKDDLVAASVSAAVGNEYTVSAGLSKSTAADVIASLTDGATVTAAGVSNGFAAGATGDAYKFNQANNTFTYNTTSTAAELQSYLTPKAGDTATFSVKIGGTKQDVVLASDGKITAKDGSKLYIDTTGNLTQNGGGTLEEATLNGLAFNHSGPAAAVQSTITTADGTSIVLAGSGDFGTTKTAGAINVTGAVISADALLSASKATGFTSGTYTVGTDGVVKSGGNDVYNKADGTGLTTDNTTKYYLQDDGSVTNGSGKAVYADATGKLTTDAETKAETTADPLKALDEAISSIDKFRSSLGAVQNRLDSAVTNLNNTTTNLSEAQSRIQDADYATEVSNMSKAQIIQQAGNSVLAKANQVPQQVLSLLQG